MGQFWFECVDVPDTGAMEDKRVMKERNRQLKQERTKLYIIRNKIRQNQEHNKAESGTEFDTIWINLDSM